MSKPLRVLQIEDSESDSDLLLLLLMQAGYEVKCTRVEDAEELRHALKDPAWDVVIADYHLPGFNAPGALKILRESGSEIPCIVVSGKMGEDVAVEVMKCGADDYLVKSNLPRLIPTLERELRSSRREGRQAQHELRENQERLALAADATELGTFDFYPQTGILFWSKFARQHFGLSPEAEVSHDSFLNGVHPDNRERVAQTVQNALLGDNNGGYAHEYRTVGLEDGKERWVQSRGRVFFDSEGRPVRLVGGMLDITEHKRLEQQAQQSPVELNVAPGETILLAEDEPLVRKCTRQILEHQGYTVLEAANGSEALALARRHRGPIHMLLTDIDMPAMGGVELAGKFASEYRGTPILFMSGRADQALPRRDALDAFLQKPFTPSVLVTQTRALLEKAGTDRRSFGVRELAAGGSA